MIGRNTNQDRASGVADRPGYDAQTKYWAGILYDDDVSAQYTNAPQNLHASNKPSEHNIANMLPRIVVAQLAPQTQPRNLKNLVSRRIVLPRGNQSIGGT